MPTLHFLVVNGVPDRDADRKYTLGKGGLQRKIKKPPTTRPTAPDFFHPLPNAGMRVKVHRAVTLLLLSDLQRQHLQDLILEMGWSLHLSLGLMEELQESLFELKMGIAPLADGKMVLEVPLGRSVQLPIQILVDPLQGRGTGDGAAGGTLLLHPSRASLLVAPTGEEVLQPFNEIHLHSSGLPESPEMYPMETA
jgi:hypothetical protein